MGKRFNKSHRRSTKKSNLKRKRNLFKETISRIIMRAAIFDFARPFS